MIEIPRAALTADEIAKEAEFFSFGTNDLTQMTFGLSRDDAGYFLPVYLEKSILDRPDRDHRPERRRPADGDLPARSQGRQPEDQARHLRRTRRRSRLGEVLP